MTSLQDEHGPIDRKIAENIIASVPDHWDKAVLAVERSQEKGDESMALSISSPDEQSGIAKPNAELFDLLYQLVDCFARHGTIWKRVEYSLSRAKGDWKYEVSYTY